MDETRTYKMRPFPRKLMRSLVTFAVAGTVMAAVVWSDGMGTPWLPLFILLACWLVPVYFAVQIRRHGFDPLLRFEASERGLEAHYREGPARFVPWTAMTQLVQVEAFRNRAWAIMAPGGALRWFGELEDPETFNALVAEKTGLNWDVQSRFPEETP